MEKRTVETISAAISFIEAHLSEKLDLETVAKGLNYSKYHLHRLFEEALGQTIHDYVRRRQLTEAARLLVFSDKPIVEIAMASDYESQQAFTGIFKAMYKVTPARYRKMGEFYPLQLEYVLEKEPVSQEFSRSEIAFAKPEDIPVWMKLVRMSVNGYPHLAEEEYIKGLKQSIKLRQALILKADGVAAGAMAFSYHTGTIEFLAVHPQYRGRNVAGAFLKRLKDCLPWGMEINVTTFRAGDKADPGYRESYRRLGFAERELLVEFGYPTQRFALPPENKEVITNEQGTKHTCWTL